jgi:hypothetical protein
VPLVVLGVDHPYSKESSCAAETAAKAIFESRGNTPRLYRNTLVFLAADKTRLQDLDEATRRSRVGVDPGDLSEPVPILFCCTSLKRYSGCGQAPLLGPIERLAPSALG